MATKIERRYLSVKEIQDKDLRKMILNTQSYEIKKYVSQMIDEIIVSNDNIDIQLNIA